MSRPYVRVDLRRNGRTERQPVSVLIRQKDGRHDVVQLKYRGTVAWKQYRKGTPIAIRFGYTGAVENFYGHVRSAKLVPRGDGTVARDLEVFCVPVSFRMNRTRVWTHRNHSPRLLAKRLAMRHRMAVKGLELLSDVRIPRIKQMGRSDWRLLLSYVEKQGLSLTARGATLHIRRRAIDSSTVPGKPTFVWRGGSTSARDAVHVITHNADSAPAVQNKRYVSASVDDQGNLFWESQEDCCADAPDFDEYVPTSAPTRLGLRGRLRSLNGKKKFYVTANATVAGHPRIRPADTIRIEGTEHASRGYWFVGTVEHRFTGTRAGVPDTYTCTLELGRETLEPECPVIEPPPVSWVGRPIVIDDTVLPRDPEVPTVALPGDSCPPLEPPPQRRCVCLQDGCRHVYEEATDWGFWTAQTVGAR